MGNYDFKNAEKKWQDGGKAAACSTPSRIFPAEYYCLVEFPYPSGGFDVGHPRSYTRSMSSRAKSVCRDTM
jgi:leucyl-tRNA synthetase